MLKGNLVFRTAEERAYYERYIVGLARDRFESVGLGNVDSIRKDIAFPQAPWDHPIHAARAGGKLHIIGEPGVGKSATLKRLLWALCLAKAKPRGGYLPTVLGALKGSNKEEYASNLLSGDVLILDDLDKLRGNGYETERILEAVDYYDRNDLAILLTMNTALEIVLKKMLKNDVPEEFVTSLESRLNNKATVHYISGIDHRRTA